MCDIGDSAEPFEVCYEEKRKARKEYKCDCCGGLIKRGEIYLRHFSKFDGELSSERMCSGCLIDRERFVDEHGFYTSPSETPDNFHECIESRESFSSMLLWARALKRMRQRRSLYQQEDHPK